MLRIVSAALEAQLRKRYSPVHVAARLAQLDELLASTRAHAQALRGELEALSAALHGRLWLPPELAAQWLGEKQDTLALIDRLIARLALARSGYAELPLDEALPMAAPEPVAWSA
jgi:MoxR-like ATPase